MHPLLWMDGIPLGQPYPGRASTSFCPRPAPHYPSWPCPCGLISQGGPTAPPAHPACHATYHRVMDCFGPCVPLAPSTPPAPHLTWLQWQVPTILQPMLGRLHVGTPRRAPAQPRPTWPPPTLGRGVFWLLANPVPGRLKLSSFYLLSPPLRFALAAM